MLGHDPLRKSAVLAVAAALLATGIVGATAMAQDEALPSCADAGDITLKVGFSEAGEVILERVQEAGRGVRGSQSERHGRGQRQGLGFVVADHQARHVG